MIITGAHKGQNGRAGASFRLAAALYGKMTRDDFTKKESKPTIETGN